VSRASRGRPAARPAPVWLRVQQHGRASGPSEETGRLARGVVAAPVLGDPGCREPYRSTGQRTL